MKRNLALTMAAVLIALSAIGNAQVTRRFAAGLQQGGPAPASGVLFSGSSKKSMRRQGTVARNLSGQAPVAPVANAKFYSAAQLVAGGYSHNDVLVGDFNGDGRKDLASVVYAGTSGGTQIYKLAILLGTANSSLFQAPVLTSVTFTAGDHLLVSDLNHDGSDDVVLIHSGSFDVLLSSGNGQFSPATSYSSPISTTAAFALVKNATAYDLVLVGTSGQVATFSGNPNGTFNTVPVQSSYPGQISSGVLADVNGDGIIDLVTNQQVFLGNGTGGFGTGTTLPSTDGENTSCASTPGCVVVADLNADGRPDIVTVNNASHTVTVFINDGNGAFHQQGSSIFVGWLPSSATIADVNGDGNADIITVNSGSSDVTILLGNGDGTFQPGSLHYATSGFPSYPAVVGDFNADGKADIIVPDGRFSLAYLQGYGDGTFLAARDYYETLTAGNFGEAISVASADFNGDGRPDFVVGQADSGAYLLGISVFLTNPDGTLQPGVNYGTGGMLNYVAVGDFNGDGFQDIVAADTSTGDIQLFLGNGDGTFQTPVSFATGASSANGIVVGDFNGDGKLDLATVVNPAGVAVMLNDGNGGFQAPIMYAISSSAWELTAADLRGSGSLDLIAAQSGTSFASVLLSNGDGTFQPAYDIDMGTSNLYAVAVGDLNGDGKNDLVVTSGDPATGGGIGVALGKGDGTFQTPVFHSPTTHDTSVVPPWPGELKLADLNRDGMLDIIYTNSNYGTVGIMFGKGDGTFYAPAEYPAGGFPLAVVLTDINGDGALDAITADIDSGELSVLLNTSGTTTSVVSTQNPSAAGQLITLTATVSASFTASTTQPTGSVTFASGATILGSALLSRGQASLSLSSLAVGSYAITAVYSGDPSFAASSSAALLQRVMQGPAPSFTLTATPSSATIHWGQPANFTILVTPNITLNGTVSFACGSLSSALSCAFSSPSVSVSGQPATVRLTITSNPLAAATTRTGAEKVLPLLATITGLFGLAFTGGKNRRFPGLALGATLVFLLLLTACGSGVQSTGTSSQTSTTVRVVGISRPNVGNSMSQTLNLSLTVQP